MDLVSFSQAIIKKLSPSLRISRSGSSLSYSGRKLYDSDIHPLILSIGGDHGAELKDVSLETCKLVKEKVFEILEARIPEVGDVNKKFQGHKIGQDIFTGESVPIENGGVMPYDFDGWKAAIPEDQYKILYELRERIVVAFDPGMPLSWQGNIETTTGPKTFPHYNTYIAAPWTRVTEPDLSIIERDVPDFLEHLVPDKYERNYVIFWLYKLMTGRCQDVLVLIGVQGNGKNLFMELASFVAGEQNSMVGAKAFGKEKFNSEVRKRKLLCLDEYQLSMAHKDAIKCWCNDNITVELKGGDPVAIKNHCSFIITHNRERSCYLEFKDRRFTAPTLGKHDLFLAWPEDRIERIFKDMLTPEFKEMFPLWVKDYVETNDISFPINRPLVTPRFYDLVEVSKPRWFKVFKSKLRYVSSVNTRDILKACKIKIDEDTVMDYLRNEEEERMLRKIEPYKIAEPIYSVDGQINFKSLLFKHDEESDDASQEILLSRL